MRPVTVVEGTMIALDRADVDTDQIMPKQFLKRIERTGFDQHLFHDWRQDPGFCLNQEHARRAKVLVSGPNFGCGSSREHAPWGLAQWGFEAIVAPSFGDIFRTNCAKIGLLTVTLPAPVCKQLIDLAERDPESRCEIDLAAQRLRAGPVDTGFDIDEHTKRMLLDGLDDIGLTLRQADDIAAFEARRSPLLPETTGG